jgi:membrane-associated phospholipid phosphatase
MAGSGFGRYREQCARHYHIVVVGRSERSLSEARAANRMTWNEIADLGGPAVMAPACLTIAVWLLASRAWSRAIRWLSLFTLAALLVAGSKIAFEAWGIGIRALDFTGISGHAMTATSVLAVAGYLFGSKLRRPGAISLALIGYGFGVLVGFSLIVNKAHSLSEVVAGCALGGSVAFVSMSSRRRRPAVIVAPAMFAVTLGAVLLAFHGTKAPSEIYIAKLAVYLSERATPYSWPDRSAPIAPGSLSSPSRRPPKNWSPKTA